ncbi:hypothetical protein EDC04DRAFT_2619335 [Pisolithus marmoratus]|nr:hypothetical protein EDC04DRAFT_2619335 [Pisolithus marmoratus]
MASGVAAAILLFRRDQSHTSSDQRSGTKSSTLDLTLWLLVYAIDASVRSRLLSRKNKATSCSMSTPMRDVRTPGTPSDGQLSYDIATSKIQRIFGRFALLGLWCKDYVVLLPRTAKFTGIVDKLARVDWRLLELLRAVASTLAADLGYPTWR